MKKVELPAQLRITVPDIKNPKIPFIIMPVNICVKEGESLTNLRYQAVSILKSVANVLMSIQMQQETQLLARTPKFVISDFDLKGAKAVSFCCELSSGGMILSHGSSFEMATATIYAWLYSLGYRPGIKNCELGVMEFIHLDHYPATIQIEQHQGVGATNFAIKADDKKRLELFCKNLFYLFKNTIPSTVNERPTKNNPTFLSFHGDFVGDMQSIISQHFWYVYEGNNVFSAIRKAKY